jgi:hypothetical protein
MRLIAGRHLSGRACCRRPHGRRRRHRECAQRVIREETGEQGVDYGPRLVSIFMPKQPSPDHHIEGVPHDVWRLNVEMREREASSVRVTT